MKEWEKTFIENSKKCCISLDEYFDEVLVLEAVDFLKILERSGYQITPRNFIIENIYFIDGNVIKNKIERCSFHVFSEWKKRFNIFENSEEKVDELISLLLGNKDLIISPYYINKNIISVSEYSSINVVGGYNV